MTTTETGTPSGLAAEIARLQEEQLTSQDRMGRERGKAALDLTTALWDALSMNPGFERAMDPEPGEEDPHPRYDEPQVRHVRDIHSSLRTYDERFVLPGGIDTKTDEKNVIVRRSNIIEVKSDGGLNGRSYLDVMVGGDSVRAIVDYHPQFDDEERLVMNPFDGNVVATRGNKPFFNGPGEDEILRGSDANQVAAEMLTTLTAPSNGPVVE